MLCTLLTNPATIANTAMSPIWNGLSKLYMSFIITTMNIANGITALSTTPNSRTTHTIISEPSISMFGMLNGKKSRLPAPYSHIVWLFAVTAIVDVPFSDILSDNADDVNV